MMLMLTVPWVIQRTREILGPAPVGKEWLEYEFAGMVVILIIAALLWLVRRFLGK